MTSHAALVARQMGKVCVAGCGELVIDYGKHAMTVKGRTLKEGDWISIDGTTGQVIEGKINTKPSEVLQVLIEKTLDPAKAPVYQTFAKVMTWADKYRTLKIRTNADQPDQSANAVAFGAEGIGLCRTEHMFFGEGKIGPMREMILADTLDAAQGGPGQAPARSSGRTSPGIFEVMAGRPVTIRTIDPPLHEFLPHEEKEQRQVAAEMGISYEKVRERVESLHEFNPMLGFRGCRLGIIYPEITEMQARAIFEAAAATQKKGIEVEPEVMIPLVGNVKELAHQEKLVRQTAEAVMKEQGVKFKYLVGTMIEIPRGALTADEIAAVAEFFSFGTNDLTQTTLGVSRDDAARFLVPYVEKEIYAKDPFEVLDRDGVGQLMRIAVEKGRKTRPDDQDRHLRRARRRSVERRVLPSHRAELRQLLAVPRAHRAPRGGPGGPVERAQSRGQGQRREESRAGKKGGRIEKARPLALVNRDDRDPRHLQSSSSGGGSRSSLSTAMNTGCSIPGITSSPSRSTG